MTINTQVEPPIEAARPYVIVPEEPMSADEFEGWAFAQPEGRYEWAHGKTIMMAPANLDHVDLNGWLGALLRLFVEQNDLGVVFGPELLLRLAESRRIPDLMFLKRENLARLKPTYVDTAPDLAVELVSRDSVARDWREKFVEYEAAGVGEYWVIDAAAQVCECYAAGSDGHFQIIAAKEEKIVSTVLPGFYLRPSWLWQSPRPRLVAVLRELGVTL